MDGTDEQMRITYHRGAPDDERSRNGYGHLKNMET